ncbi:MAG: glycosyltransferase family 2 protein [bacterium]
MNQTFREFEFIIVDDCSTNGSDAYLRSLDDPRVKLIWNKENMGVTRSLNVGLRAAKGKYIARMDSDDISLPERFQKEYDYMEAHPACVLCGTNWEQFGYYNGPFYNQIKSQEEYRARMLFANPGPRHPTAFFRHDTLLENGIEYDENFRYSQDYRIFSVICNYGEVHILDDILLKYRTHAEQISEKHRATQIQCSMSVQRDLLLKLIEDMTEEELVMHYRHSYGNFADAKISDDIIRWYKRLEAANQQKKLYDPNELRKAILIRIKVLLKQTFTEDMSAPEKLRLCYRYLPFTQATLFFLKYGMRKAENKA